MVLPLRPLATLRTVAVLAGALTFATFAGPRSAHGEESNPVVAVVNADPITRQNLADATLQRYGNSVLDNVIINRQLILEACNARGMQVSQAEVSEEISRLATKFGFSVQDYLKLLQDERDIDPGRYGREIIWPMLALRKLVADQVEPTEAEFNRAFVSQYGEAVKCRMIMVGDEQKAKMLHREAVANPANFANLAKQNSDDETSASVGGLIPPIRRYMGDTRLEEAAFELNEGDVSEVMQVGDQWLFVQAVRRMPATVPNAQAMPAIREQINDQIRDQKMKTAATDLFGKLQQEAKVIKVFGNPELEKQYPGIAAIVNESRITNAQLAAECVKRHGKDVLDGEINRKVLNQALVKAQKTVTQADLQGEIQRAAKSYGFLKADGSADLQAWIESVTSDGETTYQIYVDDAVWPSVALKKLVEDRIEVTEQDLQVGFESNFGPRVEVLACVLGDKRTAQKVWKMARDNPSEEFFGRLAEDYSVEPVSASNSGKVPPIRKYSGQPTIEREAFKLQAGELSAVIGVGDKYILLKCQGRTKPLVSDPNAVREELVRDLTERKFSAEMAQEFDKLKDAAEIENYFVAVQEIASAARAKAAQR
ncbi:peptidylprolyl isomerase [Rhodopirellula sp. MGV]|uniref:peptidylprolyl isomerase n=1 Tax=Rhodopirellula sp. MGV TaxID=2023130 RepID=UPI000B966264|nr:peptidylprolyl isomerase [Rhodopirellula sp. MGV]OYP38952.1 peptidylprolyl isomerase [Rhodopirellula sp. MGV]PNY37694.1 peptidylprolyl isomerase [Rhodopirellula baltica]